MMQGDEHTIQITGGPTASTMSLEHPEAIISVAPAEGQRPLFINFEAIFNPDNCLLNQCRTTRRGFGALKSSSCLSFGLPSLLP